jgi:DNA-binding transcriptional LysR family regulator
VRHLADWELVICASPAYLARRGTPTSPDSLAGHDLLVLPPWHHPPDVLTGPQGQRHRLGGTARVTSNNQLSLKQLALAGFGLSLQVVPEIEEELAAGRLVRVLPEWSLPTLSVDALMAQRTKQPAKVRYALDALRAYFEQAGRRARRPLASAATTG